MRDSPVPTAVLHFLPPFFYTAAELTCSHLVALTACEERDWAFVTDTSLLALAGKICSIEVATVGPTRY
jgi:hypothetical protein